MHGQTHLDFVTFLPGAGNGEIRSRRVWYFLFLPIHPHRHATGPGRVAEIERKLRGRSAIEGQRRRFLFGEFRFLPHRHPGFAPTKFRSDKKIYVKRVSAVEINGVAIFCMVFHPGAHAAPE